MLSAEPQLLRLLERAQSALEPPPVLTVSQWADRNVILPSEDSFERGSFSTDRAPYQREIMDCLSPSHPCEEVVTRMASQTGKSRIGLNFTGFIIDQDPGPLLIVHPRIEDARGWSTDRLDPLLRETKCLSGKIREFKSKDADNTKLYKKFPGGQITIVSATTPASLAARPIRYIVFEEVDRLVTSSGNEGDPIGLGLKRTATFPNRKVYYNSSPTVAGSRIDRLWLASDQRHYYVPCPQCGAEQLLALERIQTPSDDALEAGYRCQQCQELIPNYKKQWMLMNGRWIAHNPTSKIPGFTLPQFYSPFVSWGKTLEESRRSQGNPLDRQAFINTACCENYEESHEAALDEHKLLERCEPYSESIEGEMNLPDGVCILTMGVDVQDGWIEYEIVGWGRHEEAWSISHGKITGAIDSEEVWQTLDAIRLSSFYRAGVELKIRAVCIDSGFKSERVHAYTRERLEQKVFAIKGQAGANPIWPRKNTKSKFRTPVWVIGVDTAKEVIHGRLESVTRPGPGFMHFPEDRDLDYFRQLTAERQKVKFRNGYPVRIWVKPPKQRNEVFDTWIYGYAGLHALYVGGLQLPKECDRIEKLVAARVATAAIAPPPPKSSTPFVIPQPRAFEDDYLT